MTHEETVVRTAYAKLSYAVDIETVYRVTRTNHNITAADLAKRVGQDGLSFKLGEFTVGDVSEIAGLNYMTRFPQYDGEDVIHTGVLRNNYSEEGLTTSMEGLDAKWGPGPDSTGASGLLEGYTVEQMIPIIENELHVSSILRYASYTVTASLAGRSRTYKAVFFFGNNGEVAAVDPVVGTDGNNLEYFVLHPVFPDILVRTRIGSLPAVHDFLTANQKNPRPSCRSGDACCEAETMECGVLSSDLGGRP